MARPSKAVYDGSRAHAAFYKPHLDCKEPASNPRRLTAILYLQPPGWDGGGELRAWRRDGEAVEIAPLGGRLVLFRACDVLHEVRPAFATRCALTLWAVTA